ncbi:MAG: N-acetyltransferase [Anaerolineae bacterium]|nr:N-acetyltransferase [Anaerolineae bacterium]
MAKYFAHPTAIVESDKIGDDTKIWAYTHILKGVVIGANCNIGDHCFMENGVKVGNQVTIKNGNMLFEGIELEDGVFVGPHVFFTNDLFPRSPRLPEASKRYIDHSWFKPTLIKHGASLGAASVILAGSVIGEYATIGAGAVVTKDIPSYSLVVGNPSRQIGWVCQCGLRLEDLGKTFQCKSCGKGYVLDNKTLKLI